MKKLVFILLFPLFAFQCSENESRSLSDELPLKKQEILDYIGNFDCSASCNYIALGAKPCGGPREYLPFPDSVDLAFLQQMVTAYNEMDHQNNINTNAVSDCEVVLPPTSVNCVDGNCVILE